MADNEGGGNSSPYAGFVEKITANLDPDRQEIQHSGSNEVQQWREYVNLLKEQASQTDPGDRAR